LLGTRKTLDIESKKAFHGMGDHRGYETSVIRNLAFAIVKDIRVEENQSCSSSRSSDRASVVLHLKTCRIARGSAFDFARPSIEFKFPRISLLLEGAPHHRFA
jgi:hypothetical protein